MNKTQSNRNTGRKYRLILFFVIGLTAFSSAVREFQEIVQITEQVGEFISAFTNAVVPTANARTPKRVLSLSVESQAQTSEDFRWSGVLPGGKAIEIKGINGNIDAQPSNGNQIEVIAHKKSRRSDVGAVQIKVVEHQGGVTICAQYPTEDGGYTPCEPGEMPKQSGRSETRKNDVSVDFEVRVPEGVNLNARTVNGEISAKSLMSNVIARTVNGGIEISTTGYADATTVNGGITAKLGSANWTGLLHFTTVNGEIAIDVPANVSTDVEAQTLNGSIVSDFQLNLETTKSWKYLRGKIGTGGRELVLKTLNGSINLRTS
jgi:hypothetical protein